MKQLMIVLMVVLLAIVANFCLGADLALYSGEPNVDGWYTAAQVQKDVATIMGQAGALFNKVQAFGDDKLEDLAKWAESHATDKNIDVLWLNGCVPSSLYPFPNQKPDGSPIENFLDGGNLIINVADWFGYVSYEGGGRKAENGTAGAANILDLPAGIIYSADNTKMMATADGKKYLPSIKNECISYRPIALAQATSPWEVATVFASITGDEKATGADPVVIHNTKTNGYVAFINQAAGSGPPGWLDDRGLTCVEFLKNWATVNIGLKAPVESLGKLTATWGSLKK